MQLLIKDLEISKDINEKWISENCYIAGGACVSNFTRKPINDVDIYFRTKEARRFFMEKTGYLEKYFEIGDELFDEIVSYDEKISKNEIEIGEKTEFKINGENFKIESEKRKVDDDEILIFDIDNEIFISKPLLEKQKWMFENGYDYVLMDRNVFEVDGKTFCGNKSITIKMQRPGKEEVKYQFILRFYGEPEEMMDETFDFQHCKIAYDLRERKYIASQKTFECLAKKEILYVNSFYPISSLKRLYKYKERGFTYNKDQFVKIIRDIHKVDVDNKYVLEDQLIGYYEDFDYNQVFCEEPVLIDCLF